MTTFDELFERAKQEPAYWDEAIQLVREEGRRAALEEAAAAAAQCPAHYEPTDVARALRALSDEPAQPDDRLERVLSDMREAADFYPSIVPMVAVKRWLAILNREPGE